VSINIDETLYPLSLADHNPPLTSEPRDCTVVERALGLHPGDELDIAWYKGVSPLQLQEREARRRAHYYFLKRL
jgi:hypothetical protein